MTKTPGSGSRSARRRRQQAEAVAEDIEEILADFTVKQTRRSVRLFRQKARPLLVAREFGLYDEPTPPVDATDAWDLAEWERAVAEIDMVVSNHIVTTLDGYFGIKVNTQQPFVQRRAAEHIEEIEAWSDDFKTAIGDAIDRGHREAMSVRQVADQIQHLGDVTERRAKAIAQTEMVAASNAASNSAMLQLGARGDRKRWISTRDSRTRDDHRAANGQEVPYDEPFIVGGERGDYPGHRRFTPAQRANCRCTVVWVPADDPFNERDSP